MKNENSITDNGISAVFTKFESGTNWCDGTVGKYNFQAKLFDYGSDFGIDEGRVSKLSIWNQAVREEKQDFLEACIVNYDRGWDIKPEGDTEPYFNAVMELLENAPKRF